MLGGDSVKKFWNKAENSNDIFIYGDIASYAWFDNDTTAKSFMDDLNSFKGQPVTVHINSGGGDVFAGLAISNAIKNYGKVTVAIDGLAASAASLIAMGGQKVTMASNALMMIHEARVGVMGYFDIADLTKMQNELTAIKGSIIATYKSRAKDADIQSMVEAETWFNAQEALDAGFIDEITGEVSLSVDDANKKLFVNSLAIDTSKFDAVKMRQAMGGKKMSTENKAPATETTPAVNAEEILKQERQRVRDLQGLKCDNAAVNAIIEVAMSDGRTVADIQAYVDALKKIPPAQNTAGNIADVIRDQMTSGAAGVSGSQDAPDEKELQRNKIAAFANGMV